MLIACLCEYKRAHTTLHGIVHPFFGNLRPVHSFIQCAFEHSHSDVHWHRCAFQFASGKPPREMVSMRIQLRSGFACNHVIQLTLLFRSSKFLLNPLMPKIKWWSPGENQLQYAIRFIVLSYSRNGYSKNFLRYDCDPGGILVVLVIRCCVHTTKTMMETASSVGEDGREVNEGKSTGVTP